MAGQTCSQDTYCHPANIIVAPLLVTCMGGSALITRPTPTLKPQGASLSTCFTCGVTDEAVHWCMLLHHGTVAGAHMGCGTIGAFDTM